MNLLVAGHGYLGSELARQALVHVDGVYTLSKSGGDGSLACDLSDAGAVGGLAAAIPADLVVHCASSGRGGAEAYRSVFLEGSRNLLKAFPDSRLVFVSSTSVYGQTDGSAVDETSATEPDRETSRLLLEAERVVLAAGGTVVRLAGIYGPGRSVILRKFLSGEAVIEEDGRRILNQIHRDDAASAILHLATLPEAAGQVYNVADNEPMSQLECYSALAETFHRPLPPTGPRPQNRKRAWTHKRVSNAKLLATGWGPGFPSFLAVAGEIAPTLD